MLNFADEVYAVVRSVPPGRVTTYGTISKLLGHYRRARMVGWAMRRCPDDVPAHRVVGAGGHLTGGWAFGHPSVQRAMLEEEGVRFIGDERCDLRAHLWPDDVRTDWPHESGSKPGRTAHRHRSASQRPTAGR